MALKELRKASTGWVASIFIGLIIVSFTIWGINDIFSGPQARGIAKVGDTWISPLDYQRRLGVEMRQMSEQMGREISFEEARTFGVTRQILDLLIDTTALEISASRLGLRASDETLKRSIRATPAFQRPDGSFDEQIYRGALQQLGFTPVSYESEIRKEVVRGQLIAAIMAGGVMPRSLLSELVAYRGEQREISYIAMPQSAAGDIPAPDDQTLASYIAAHAERFSSPERRSFVAVLLRGEDFADEVEVTEDKIAEQYELTKERYLLAETREVRTMAFASAEEASAALASLRSGAASFEALGAARGLSPEELAYKAQTRADFLDTQVADGVFGAAAPGLVGPIEGTLGVAIADIKAITPGRQRTLDEVREDIRASLASSLADDLAYQTVGALEDGRGAGETLEAIAARLDLTLLRFDNVDRTGKTRTGIAPVAIDDVELLLTSAFDSEVDQEKDVESLPSGGQFVVRVDAIEPVAVRALDDVRAEASEAFIAEERARRLSTRAEEMIAKSAGGGIGAIAAALGTAPQALGGPIRRQDRNEFLSADLVAGLFRARLGGLVVGRSGNGADVVIASVMRIDSPSSEERTAGVEALAATLDDRVRNNILTQYIAGLRADYGVRISEPIYEQASSGARYN